MGEVASIEIDNALYGHKTDLKSQLRRDAVPLWLKPATARDVGRVEYLEEQKKNNFSTYAVFTIRDNRGNWANEHAIPDDIKDRIEEFLESDEQQQRQMNMLRPGEYWKGIQLTVRLGDRGGIKNLMVESVFRD